MTELSLDQKFTNMKTKYRETQKELKEVKALVLNLIKDFDGSRAVDIWDEDQMPSKEWINRMYKVEEKLTKL